MSNTTFLHIRRRDSSPTQVLELAESSIRVGRGPDCEIRLGGETLAELHCRLSRQGDDWQVEPEAEVLIDGKPVEGTRPLAPGDVLKVGDHWLSLEPGSPPTTNRGSFDSPIVVDSVEVEAAPKPERAQAAPRVAPADFDAVEARMARWHASQQERDRLLKDRQKEQGWEARWRAAGDALRARSESATPPAPKPAASYSRPEPAIATQPRIAPRPTPVATVPDRMEAPRPIPLKPATMFPRLEEMDDEEAPATIPFPSPVSTTFRIVDDSEIEPQPIELATELDSEPIELVESPIEARLAAEPSDPPTFEAEFPPEPPPFHDPASRVDDHGWPTVQSILASRPAARGPARSSAASTGRGVRPKALADEFPTEARPPRHWTVPGWLALPIAVFTSVTVGCGGSALAWTWAKDAQTTGPIADRVLKGGMLPNPGELPDVASVPGSWWGSSSGHLYLFAVAADRSESDPDREEHTRFFLQAARAASPLRADVRLALARLPRREMDAKAVSDTGLSRDVVALAWTGHELLASGRIEESKAAYFASLDLACRAEPREAVPALDEEQDSRRFRIAGEEAIEPVLNDMAEGPDWSFAQWSSALPTTAVAQLAAYRVLKARESPDAARVLEAAATAPEPPAIYPRSLHLAARAEALAIQGRWADAEPIYRDALSIRQAGAIKRSWWANLADLDGRIGEEARRRDAWEAAIAGASASDEIGRVVARARSQAGLVSRNEPVETQASQSQDTIRRR